MSWFFLILIHTATYSLVIDSRNADQYFDTEQACIEAANDMTWTRRQVVRNAEIVTWCLQQGKAEMQ